MFLEAEDLSSSAERFAHRLKLFKRDRRAFPRTRHFFYWLVHNLIAHPLLGLFPSKLTVRFHSVTSNWLNHRSGWNRIDPEPPRPTKWGWWLLHNIVAHFAIGLFPFATFPFRLHDWTAEKMDVPGWV